MQQARLWEITADRKLPEIPARYASLEEWIEDWLADDISVLDPNLLVIGRQVRTSFGSAVGRKRLELSGGATLKYAAKSSPKPLKSDSPRVPEKVV